MTDSTPQFDTPELKMENLLYQLGSEKFWLSLFISYIGLFISNEFWSCEFVNNNRIKFLYQTYNSKTCYCGMNKGNLYKSAA